jgi:Domain of unknown function (DUF4365)
MSEGRRMLDANQHQGKFGEDYVRVLASAAGLIVFKEDIDVTGVDLGFRAHGEYAKARFPTIEAQVKTCSVPEISSGILVFRGLDQERFNMLAGPGFTVPRFLFVICVPRESQMYAVHSSEGVMLQRLGYFVSLEAEKPIENPDRRRRRTVCLPKMPSALVSADATVAADRRRSRARPSCRGP